MAKLEIRTKPIKTVAKEIGKPVADLIKVLIEAKIKHDVDPSGHITDTEEWLLISYIDKASTEKRKSSKHRKREKEIRYRKTVDIECPQCHGKGIVQEFCSSTKCLSCSGEGNISRKCMACSGTGLAGSCHPCNGKGFFSRGQCVICGGSPFP